MIDASRIGEYSYGFYAPHKEIRAFALKHSCYRPLDADTPETESGKKVLQHDVGFLQRVLSGVLADLQREVVFHRAIVTEVAKKICPEITEEVGCTAPVMVFFDWTEWDERGFQPTVFDMRRLKDVMQREGCWWETWA